MQVLKVSIRQNDRAIVKTIVNNVKNNEARLFSIPKNPPQKLFLSGPPNTGKALSNQLSAHLKEFYGKKLDAKPAKPAFLSMNLPKDIDEFVKKRISFDADAVPEKFDSAKVSAMLDEICGKKLDIKPFNKNELMERFAKKIEIKNPNQLD